MKKSKEIVRKFEVPEDQGIVALLIGCKHEGLSLHSVRRKGKKATAIYKEK